MISTTNMLGPGNELNPKHAATMVVCRPGHQEWPVSDLGV